MVHFFSEDNIAPFDKPNGDTLLPKARERYGQINFKLLLILR